MIDLFRKNRRLTIRDAIEAQPLRMVADAAIASSSLVHGKLVALLIVDTNDRPDIEELLRVHDHLPPGDVSSTWVRRSSQTARIALLLEFIRPMDVWFMLEFDIVRQGALVDLILEARCFYLQTGKDGDRFVNTKDANRIVVEVPHTGFEKKWDCLLEKEVRKDMQRKNGLARAEAKIAARQFIQEWRKLARIRIPS